MEIHNVKTENEMYHLHVASLCTVFVCVVTSWVKTPRWSHSRVACSEQTVLTLSTVQTLCSPCWLAEFCTAILLLVFTHTFYRSVVWAAFTWNFLCSFTNLFKMATGSLKFLKKFFCFFQYWRFLEIFLVESLGIWCQRVLKVCDFSCL